MKELEKEWVAIAEKYIPDITEDQRKLVRSIARCRKYNGEGFKEVMMRTSMPVSPPCHCTLCLRVTMYEIKKKLGTPPTP